MRPDRPCKLCLSKRWGSSSYCYRDWKIREKAKREEKRKKKDARRKGSKKYQVSITKLWHRKCWKLMSEWIRRKDADFAGYNSCYTCSKKFPWRELHAGHHFHGKLDFDERNLRPQCAGCNTYRGGMLNVYARRLIQENGLPWYEQLEQDAARHAGYTLTDLQKIHTDLTEKLTRLK